jgi:hypothetical protein
MNIYDGFMTLQDALNITAEQFEEACEAARVDYSTFKPINTDSETMETAIDGFSKFESPPESFKAIHNAGKMVP